MTTHVTGLDHVVICVHDLEHARNTYARLGFTLTARGHHSIGSQNHCIMFGSDYIELLAVPRPHPANRYFTDFLAAGDGLAAIAIASDDANAAHAAFKRAGIEAAEPLDISRPVESGAEARFRIVQLPVAQTPGCRMFLCQHFTRELVWRPEHQSHALGATGLAAVAVVVEDPEAEAQAYARVFGAAPLPIDEGLLVETGAAPIALASRWKLGHRLHGVALPLRRRPLVAALFIRVADRACAAQALRKSGFSPAALADGSYAIGADQAHGVALVFG